MNEAQWLACEDPGELIDEVNGRDAGSVRKFRLFSCACARILWHLMPNVSRAAVEVTEQFADGLATEAELDAAHMAAYGATHQFPASDPRLNATLAAWRAAWTDARGNHGNAEGAGYVVLDIPMAIALERQPDSLFDPASAVAREMNTILCDLCRCIMGNPFRLAALERTWLAWNDGTIQKMAQVIYDDRAFDRLPVLADALEDAGCTDADILAHCRGSGPHVRGCWVVDLLTGKA